MQVLVGPQKIPLMKSDREIVMSSKRRCVNLLDAPYCLHASSQKLAEVWIWLGGLKTNQRTSPTFTGPSFRSLPIPDTYQSRWGTPTPEEDGSSWMDGILYRKGFQIEWVPSTRGIMWPKSLCFRFDSVHLITYPLIPQIFPYKKQNLHYP